MHVADDWQHALWLIQGWFGQSGLAPHESGKPTSEAPNVDSCVMELRGIKSGLHIDKAAAFN